MDPKMLALLPVFFRQVVLVIAGGGAFYAMLSRGDFVAVMSWLRTDDGALFITTLVAVVTTVYGWYRSWQDKKEK